MCTEFKGIKRKSLLLLVIAALAVFPLFCFTACSSMAGGSEIKEEADIEFSVSEAADTISFSISCANLTDEENRELLDPEKLCLVPEDGWILEPTELEISDGESVFDVLQRVCREKRIHLEFSYTPIYESAYIEGIGNLYEFDAGSLSGWMYSVNGAFPNYGCSKCAVHQGDSVEWLFTCDLGADVGNEF